ncbi:MAG: hypothetical protein JSW49_05325 [candidate division WOR-3 bacterium]|nr:MAG: hypothetical protein JSW49_05325 [candidate division WOR-3 bacterium]
MPVPGKRYKIEIEIFEGKGGQLQKDGNEIIYPDLIREGICAWMYRGDGEKSYRKDQKFLYPEDKDKICPWLLDSMQTVLARLIAGETLNWDYKDTPYEKVIEPDGVTTEFVRCIDPTASGIVVKVIRTMVQE